MAQILSKRRQQSSSKSFILRVHDVLMRDNVRSIGPGCAGMITCYTDVSPPKSQFSGHGESPRFHRPELAVRQDRRLGSEQISPLVLTGSQRVK